MKMNRFATIFFSRTHCLLSERFSQMMSLGGGAYLLQRLQTQFSKSDLYQTFHLSVLLKISDRGGLNLKIQIDINLLKNLT